MVWKFCGKEQFLYSFRRNQDLDTALRMAIVPLNCNNRSYMSGIKRLIMKIIKHKSKNFHGIKATPATR